MFSRGYDRPAALGSFRENVPAINRRCFCHCFAITLFSTTLFQFSKWALRMGLKVSYLFFFYGGVFLSCVFMFLQDVPPNYNTYQNQLSSLN